METFVVAPAENDHVIFQEGMPPRHRLAEFSVATSELPSAKSKIQEDELCRHVPATSTALTSMTPDPAPAPMPPVYTASTPKVRDLRTREWLHHATSHLIDTLLNPKIDKDAALFWKDVLDVDMDTLIERQRQRGQRSAEALQSSIEASLPERSKALMDERNRCMKDVEQYVDDLEDTTSRCVDAIQSACHTSLGLRTRMRNDHRCIDDTKASLTRLCAPQPYRRWASHIHAILDEESTTAYDELENLASKELQGIRGIRPVIGSPPPVMLTAGSPHLQSLMDAAATESNLRAIQTLRSAATGAADFVASCASCRGPESRCKSCEKIV